MELAREIALAVARILYLFSPLLVAAAASAVVLRLDLLPSLRRPIDGGLSFRGRRVFGDNKTWRIVVVAIVASIATVAAQRTILGDAAGSLAVIDYARANPLWLGAAMGAGAMIGELPNSFVKRRLGIAPGASARGLRRVAFYIWDQVDLLTGAWPMILPWVIPDALLVATSFAVALALHPIVALIGYVVGARARAR